MPLLQLIPEPQKQRILQAYRNALCDDYCAVDNCERCNRVRLEESLPLIVEALVMDLRQRWLNTEKLVADGVKHIDALNVLTEILTDLDSPPKRKPLV